MERQRDHFNVDYDPLYIMHTNILSYTPFLEDEKTSTSIPMYPTFVSSKSFTDVNSSCQYREWMGRNSSLNVSGRDNCQSWISLFSFLYRSGVGAESSMSICKLLLNMQKCYIRKTSVKLLWPRLFCLGI